MGLDMHMYGKRYYSGFDERRPREKDTLGKDIVSQDVDLGYWRKHPNLHGFIVQQFAGGVDDCREVEMTADQLREILDAVRSNSLPHTTGFFFGESGSADQQDTIPKLEEAIVWLEAQEEPGVWKSVAYQASW